MAVVIFFSSEGREVGAVERESESMSRKWKEGLREVSRPYLIESTIRLFLRVLLMSLSTYRCSSELLFPE